MSPEYSQTLRKSQVFTGSAARKTSPLRLVSLGIALLSVCFSIAVIATTADAYTIYKSQSKAMNPWWLPLWPGHFNTKGSRSMIGAAVGVLIMNGSFLVFCLVPKLEFHGQSLRTMLIAVFTAMGTSVIALASVIHNAILNRDNRSRETIQTWTCRFAANIAPKDVNLDGQPENMSNLAFGKMCTESKFAFWTLVVIVILQAALFSVSIAQWAMSFWKNTKNEFGDERPDTGTEMESQKDLNFHQEYPKQSY